MLIFVASALLLCMGVMLVRVLQGPTLHDRILAVNVFNTSGVLLILVLGVLVGEQLLFVDVSLVYACVGFISTIGLVKFSLDDDVRRSGW